MGDSLNIPALRAKAKSYRDKAHAFLGKADAIDGHIDALLALVGEDVEAQPREKRARSERGAKMPGKKPGTMSFKWREHLAAIGGEVGVQFEIKQVLKRVKAAEDRDMRASEVRRQFKVYVEHGYLEAVDDNTYRMNRKLIELLDQLPESEGPPAETEGPNTGGVAERSIASDSKSDGVTSKPAPVGSNPTASAPAPSRDYLAAFGITNPQTD